MSSPAARRRCIITCGLRGRERFTRPKVLSLLLISNGQQSDNGCHYGWILLLLTTLLLSIVPDMHLVLWLLRYYKLLKMTRIVSLTENSVTLVINKKAIIERKQLFS